jgi:hypothetical protein
VDATRVREDGAGGDAWRGRGLAARPCAPRLACGLANAKARPRTGRAGAPPVLPPPAHRSVRPSGSWMLLVLGSEDWKKPITWRSSAARREGGLRGCRMARAAAPCGGWRRMALRGRAAAMQGAARPACATAMRRRPPPAARRPRAAPRRTVAEDDDGRDVGRDHGGPKRGRGRQALEHRVAARVGRREGGVDLAGGAGRGGAGGGGARRALAAGGGARAPGSARAAPSGAGGRGALHTPGPAPPRTAAPALRTTNARSSSGVAPQQHAPGAGGAAGASAVRWASSAVYCCCTAAGCTPSTAVSARA